MSRYSDVWMGNSNEGFDGSSCGYYTSCDGTPHSGVENMCQNCDKLTEERKKQIKLGLLEKSAVEKGENPPPLL